MAGGRCWSGFTSAAGSARHKAELRLAIRVSVAGLLALLLADVFNLPRAVWAAITAVNVRAGECRCLARSGHGLAGGDDRRCGSRRARGARPDSRWESWLRRRLCGARTACSGGCSQFELSRRARRRLLILLLGTTAGKFNLLRAGTSHRDLPWQCGRHCGCAAASCRRTHIGWSPTLPSACWTILPSPCRSYLGVLRSAPRPGGTSIRFHAVSRAGLQQAEVRVRRSAARAAQLSHRETRSGAADPHRLPLARRPGHARPRRGGADTGAGNLPRSSHHSSLAGKMPQSVFLAQIGATISARQPSPLLRAHRSKLIAAVLLPQWHRVRRPAVSTSRLSGHDAGRVSRARFRVRAALLGSVRSPQSRCRARAATPVGFTAFQPPTAFAFGKKSCSPPIL